MPGMDIHEFEGRKRSAKRYGKAKRSHRKSVSKCGSGRVWVKAHKDSAGHMHPGMCRKKGKKSKSKKSRKSRSRKSKKSARKHRSAKRSMKRSNKKSRSRKHKKSAKRSMRKM